MLDKKAILAASDLGLKEIQMKEWGGSVYIRQLSGKEREEFEEETTNLDSSEKQTDQVNAMAVFCSYIICDDKRNRLFTSEEADQLAEKSFNSLKHVFNEGMLLNSIRSEDIEELTKN